MADSTEQRCEATIRARELGGRCSNRAKVKIAGSWLCGVHARKAPLAPWMLEVKPSQSATDGKS